MDTNDKIEKALHEHFTRDAADEASIARVMAKLHGTLPPQKRSWFRSLPELLLDWQFAPAWPRMAALAGCAALGLLAGTAGIDRIGRFVPGAHSDMTQALFEPEPLTGLRP
jgi:hypothetical protein